MQVDYLKIDGSFVRDMVDDPMDEAMVSSINQVGHVIGLKTIAEFVESDAVLVRLREMGVDFAQGYCIEQPKPLEDLIASQRMRSAILRQEPVAG
jgi:EAL domain-containing protein (putative c-di-GMP-specific phosphodiesterase class I)